MDESNDTDLTWILPGDNVASDCSALDWTSTLKREKDRVYGMVDRYSRRLMIFLLEQNLTPQTSKFCLNFGPLCCSCSFKVGGNYKGIHSAAD